MHGVHCMVFWLSSAASLTQDWQVQAGLEPHLGSALRLLCQCVLPSEPEHCHIRCGQPAPAGHEVPGKG